jgi:hypothetical protein
MKKGWIQIMKKTKRLKLSYFDNFSHYFIVVYLLLPFIFFLPDIHQIYVTKTFSRDLMTEDFIKLGLPSLIISIIVFIIQRRELEFKVVKFNTTFEQFQEALERTSRQLKWKIEICNSNFVQARRGDHWTSQTLITIIREKDIILFNSARDPDQRRGYASTFGWNKKNFKTFLSNLNDVTRGIPEIIKNEIPEKEWSLKMILFRIFVYPFCILFIFFGIYIVLHFDKFNNILLGIAINLIGIAGLYFIYLDLKILLFKKYKQL